MILPSYPLSVKDIQLTRAYFEKIGMEVIIPPDILGEDLICANNDANRLSFLKAALTDPTTEIIWLLNGGYGLTRIIPGLLDLKKT